MKRIIATIFGFGLSVTLALATDANWINGGVTNVVIPIDATNVINNGGGVLTAFSSPYPFDTSNTRNFTNSGTMNGSVGFRFDNAPRNSAGSLVSPRRLAANFQNKNTGIVTATDGLVTADLLLGFNTVSYLLVHATNIVNQGSLAVGAGGLLQLVGTNVNIARGSLAVNSIASTGSINGRTNFTPDIAITDNYWGQSNDTFNVTQIASDLSVPVFTPSNTIVLVTNLVARSPVHEVINDFGNSFAQVQVNIPYDANFTNVVGAYSNVIGGVAYSLTNALGGVTNIFSPTNIVRQVVFVGLASTNTGANILFYPSPQPTNLFRTVEVQVYALQTNVIASTSDTNSIYFYDTLASTTNRGNLLNTGNRTTSRPANYLLSRQPSFQFFGGGQPGNVIFTNRFLTPTNLDYANSYGLYAGYSATLDNLVSRPPNIPSGDYTNNPGRIEIQADQLDMNKARIRAEGLLSIQARHLISSSNAVVDSENISLNLGSTNGTLRVQSLMKETVDRLRGDINAWSGVWTNSYTEILTNYTVGAGPAVPAFITNTVNMNFHVLILDAAVLLNQLPVTVFELRAKATNVVVSDNGIIGRTLLIQSDSLTLNGNLTLTSNLQNWSQSLVPTLKYFTNTGVMTIPNEAHFGDEGVTPYLSFVNLGFIQSYGQNIRSDYARLSGTNSAAAAFSLQALNGQIDGAQIYAGGAVTLAGNAIRLNQTSISSSGLLQLNVTNSLSDDGAASTNTITVGDGFFMATKPTTGDLLGTAFISAAPNFAQVNHIWAGRDDGASLTGYSNNVALGKLTLLPQGLDPLFVFSGAGVANSLYVDRLDLSLLSDYSSQLQIDPNLTIYYAAASLSTNSAPTNGVSTEEFLNGQFVGRLRWVKNFSGPNSSTNVVINGNQTISVNLALRNSNSIDSDADGIVNALDASPFGGVTINSIIRNVSPAGYKLTWNAAPNTLYRVEARTNLITSAWSVLFTTTSTNTIVAPWTVLDTNAAPAGVTRYYRVTYSPN